MHRKQFHVLQVRALLVRVNVLLREHPQDIQIEDKMIAMTAATGMAVAPPSEYTNWLINLEQPGHKRVYTHI
jgi:hypothetical protein